MAKGAGYKPTWLRLVLEEIAQRGYNRALKVIPDKETPDIRPKRNIRPLKEKLRIIIDNDTTARLYIPHYWALYVHDGYNAFRPVSKKIPFLIWFRDPEEDPRLENGAMPERWSEVIHLTSDQYKALVLRNAKNRSLGLPPVAYMAPMLPGKQGTFFFDNSVGFAGFLEEANAAAGPIVRQKLLDDLRDLLEIKDVATAVLSA